MAGTYSSSEITKLLNILKKFNKPEVTEGVIKVGAALEALNKVTGKFTTKAINLKFKADVSSILAEAKKIQAVLTKTVPYKKLKGMPYQVGTEKHRYVEAKKVEKVAGKEVYSKEIKELTTIERIHRAIYSLLQDRKTLEQKLTELAAGKVRLTKTEAEEIKSSDKFAKKTYKDQAKQIDIKTAKDRALQTFRNKIAKARINSENKLRILSEKISLNKVKGTTQDMQLLKHAYRRKDVLNSIAITKKNEVRLGQLQLKNKAVIRKLERSIATKVTAGAKAQEKARRAAVGLGQALKTSFNEAFSLEKITNRIAFVMTAKLAYDVFDRINHAIRAMVVNSVKFEASMSTIYTLLNDSQKVLKKMLSKEVLGAMAKYGEDMETATRAMYDILSARISPEWAGFVLETSMKAATAGFTDVKVAGDAVTTMLNSFNLSASRAVDVSDLLFTIIKYGKCLTGDTKILLSDGSYTRIDKLKGNVEIISWDYKNFIPMTAKFVDMGVKETIKLITQDGRIIKTTPEHPYLTPNGWKRVDEISIDDKIAVPNSLPFFGNIKPQEGLAELLGYLLAEGSIYSATPRLAIANPIILQKVKEATDKFGIIVRKSNLKDKSKCASYSLPFNKTRGINKKNPLTEILKKYKLHGCTCYNKFIPEEVFRWKKNYIAKLLRAYFNGDGAFYRTKSFHLDFTSVSEQLVRDISHLLLRFGITGKIRKKKTTWIYKNIKKESFAWEWSTSRYVNIRRYLDFIGIDKSDKTVSRFENYQPNRDANAKHLNSFGKVRLQPTRHKKYKSCISPETQVDYVKVKNIIPSKVEKVYDLVVPVLHNFVASDIVCHNTVMEELGPDLGKVTASANLLGISMEEVGAALATMTQTGLKTNVAITSLRQLMITLASPTDKARKIFKKYDLQLDLATVKQKGLAYAVRQLNGLTEEEIVTIAKSRRGFMALAVAMGRNNVYLENYNHMLNRAGASQAAFEERAQTLEFQVKKLKQSFITMGLGLRGFVTTVGKPLLKFVEGITVAFSAWYIVIPVIIGLMIALNKAVLSVTTVFKTLFVTLLTNPVFMATTAFIVLASVIGHFISKAKKAKEELEAWNRQVLVNIQADKEHLILQRDLLKQLKDMSVEERDNTDIKDKLDDKYKDLIDSGKSYADTIETITVALEDMDEIERKRYKWMLKEESEKAKEALETLFKKKLKAKPWSWIGGGSPLETLFEETDVEKFYREITERLDNASGKLKNHLEKKQAEFPALISSKATLEEFKEYDESLISFRHTLVDQEGEEAKGIGDLITLHDLYLKTIIKNKQAIKDYNDFRIKSGKTFLELTKEEEEQVASFIEKYVSGEINTLDNLMEKLKEIEKIREDTDYLDKKRIQAIYGRTEAYSNEIKSLKSKYESEVEWNEASNTNNKKATEAYKASIKEKIDYYRNYAGKLLPIQEKLYLNLLKQQNKFSEADRKTGLEIAKQHIEIIKLEEKLNEKTTFMDVIDLYDTELDKFRKNTDEWKKIFDSKIKYVKSYANASISAVKDENISYANQKEKLTALKIEIGKYYNELIAKAEKGSITRMTLELALQEFIRKVESETQNTKIKIAREDIKMRRLEYQLGIISLKELQTAEMKYAEIVLANSDSKTAKLQAQVSIVNLLKKSYSLLSEEEKKNLDLVEFMEEGLKVAGFTDEEIKRIISRLKALDKAKISWKAILGIPKDTISFIQGQLQNIYKSAEDWILNYHLQRLEKSHQGDLEYLDKQRALETSAINKTVLTQAHKAKAIEALNKKHEKKKAKLEEKYAKEKAEAERDKAIFSIVIETAKGLVAAFPNFVQMAILSALSAAQIAIVSAAKYAGGGFTGEGKKRDETGKRVAGVVHEKEFVFKEQATEGNVAAFYAMQRELSKGKTFDEFTLDYLQNRIKGFIPREISQPRLTYAGGGYANSNTTINNDYSGLESKMDKVVDVFNKIEYIGLEPLGDREIYKMSKRGKKISGEF